MTSQEAKSRKPEAGRMAVEITGVFDGVAVFYYPKRKRFEWTLEGIAHTTAKYRMDFEKDFLKDFE